MPIQKPWTVQPKRSLGIFDELGGILDARDGRKAQQAKAQQTLEDRLIANQQREAANKSRTIEDALHEAQAEGERAKTSAMSAPKVPKIIGTKEDPITGEVFNTYDDGTAKPVTMPESGGILGGIKPLRLGVKPKEAPPEDKTLVPVQQEDGTTIYMPRAQAVGKKVPGPSSTGAAAMKTAIANNKNQLFVIDDALKELDAHSGAVGLTRGLPVVGDRLDQRVDPNGVAARAMIANIGSLKLHDRSGASVNIHEFPRLAPFIPNIGDTPDAIRTKLGKLREQIQNLVAEMEAGSTGGGNAPKPSGARAPAGADPEFDALMAKYTKKP